MRYVSNLLGIVCPILVLLGTQSLASPMSPPIRTKLAHDGGAYEAILVLQDPTSTRSAGFAENQNGRPNYNVPTHTTVASNAKAVVEFQKDNSTAKQTIEVPLGGTIKMDLAKGDYDVTVTIPQDTYSNMRSLSRKLGGKGKYSLSQRVQALPASDETPMRRLLVITVR